MRCSLVLLAASLVSANVLPRQNAPNLPKSDFGRPRVVSFEDAKNRLDLIGKNITDTPVSFADLLSNGAATPQSASAASCSASPGMRFEWRNYSQSDRLALMAAIKCLMGRPPSGNFPPATNRYEDFVRVHQNFEGNIHLNAKFIVWHRYFLWTFEQVLRAECGLDRAFPWWDETKDAGNFARSDLFTQPYFGNLLPAQSNGQGWCINSGAFGGITLHIGPGYSNQAYCLTRALDEQSSAQCNQGYVDLCLAYTSYADFASCVETGPHGHGHNGIGGTMSDIPPSPGDPIFWIHHLFVDHIFRIWQNADPTRIQTINGNDAQGNPLTLDTMVSVGGIRPDVRVRDIINTLGGVVIGGVPFCYRYDY